MGTRTGHRSQILIKTPQTPVMECFEPDEFRLLAKNLRTEDFFFWRDWDSTTSRAGEAGSSSIPDQVGESGRIGRL